MIEGTTYNSSIPGSIDVNQLEESFNKILTEINVYVASNDIETCHRISTKDSSPTQEKNIHLTLTVIPFLLSRI